MILVQTTFDNTSAAALKLYVDYHPQLNNDGASWSNVEETSSCGYVADRTFGFNTADATYTANDAVAAWEGVGSC